VGVDDDVIIEVDVVYEEDDVVVVYCRVLCVFGEHVEVGVVCDV